MVHGRRESMQGQVPQVAGCDLGLFVAKNYKIHRSQSPIYVCHEPDVERSAQSLRPHLDPSTRRRGSRI